MGAAAEFDIGPLTWVKGEIEQSLAKAGGALADYLADPSASTQLKLCKTHLHQAHGALEIVGLEGVTRRREHGGKTGVVRPVLVIGAQGAKQRVDPLHCGGSSGQ